MSLLLTDYYKKEFEGIRSNISCDTALAYLLTYLGREEKQAVDFWATVLRGQQICQINEYMFQLYGREG